MVQPRISTDLGTSCFCAVAVNSTHVFLAGGKITSSVMSDKAYLFNTATDEWTPLPTMRTTRYYHTCGAYGNEVIVFGSFQGIGVNETDIYSTITLQRRDGPATPGRLKFYSSRTVPYGGSFLTIGGTLDVSMTKNVYRYNPATEAWDLFPERLETAASFHDVAVVTSADVTC